jgi:pyrroline-5-carboxylate reductase
MEKNKKVIGIIGYGNMGKAIAERIKPAFNAAIFEKDVFKVKNASGVFVASCLSDLAKHADVVILAVKPQDFSEILKEIKNYIDDKLIISIAAGIPTKYIEKVLGKVRVIRVMPNLPAKIGKGMSCLCKGKFAKPSDLKFAKKIFDLLGETLILDENMMDKATATSGSGPGFLYSLISRKSLKEAKEYAKNEFFPVFATTTGTLRFTKLQARKIAKVTTSGSIEFLEKTGLSAEDLAKQVASRGGTTEAGLKELKGNVKFLPKAVKAALKRAKELSRR